jgi:hypothetical protein
MRITGDGGSTTCCAGKGDGYKQRGRDRYSDCDEA